MIFGEGPIIKNIAGDMNKLFLQGSRVGQPITNVEGDAAADQGTTDLLAAMDPVIQEVAVGMSGEESRHYTVSGNPPLAITDSLGKPLSSWSVELLPYQEGSGDPSPTNIRPIHGTNKLNLFVEESYDPSATPKAVIEVPPLSANQWDEEWEVGKISTTTGGNITGNNEIRSKNYITVQPSTEYAVVVGGTTWIAVETYKADKTFLANLGSVANGRTFTTPVDCHYVRFYTAQTYGTTYLYDIAINYPSTVTTYNRYNATVYTATIGSGGGESRDAIVDLWTLDWNYRDSNTTFWALLPNSQMYDANTLPPMLCEAYPTGLTKGYTSTAINDKTVIMATGRRYVLIKDTDYTDTDLFKASLNGVHLVYELENPTTFAVPSVTIPTPTGNATTWATAEDGTVDSMEVTYVGKA